MRTFIRSLNLDDRKKTIDDCKDEIRNKIRKLQHVIDIEFKPGLIEVFMNDDIPNYDIVEALQPFSVSRID